MGQQATCPVAFLTDVTIAIERHLAACGEPRKWISFSSLVEMVNRVWSGTSVAFTEADVRKAIRELVAIDALILSGHDTSGIYVKGQPKRPQEEACIRVFFGTMGAYSNPTPPKVLSRVLHSLPASGHYVNMDVLAAKVGLPVNTIAKVLRELRLIGAFSFVWRGDNAVMMTRRRNHVSWVAYEEVFGVDPYQL